MCWCYNDAICEGKVEKVEDSVYYACISFRSDNPFL